jgi:hypothetical protein
MRRSDFADVSFDATLAQSSRISWKKDLEPIIMILYAAARDIDSLKFLPFLRAEKSDAMSISTVVPFANILLQASGKRPKDSQKGKIKEKLSSPLGARHSSTFLMVPGLQDVVVTKLWLLRHYWLGVQLSNARVDWGAINYTRCMFGRDVRINSLQIMSQRDIYVALKRVLSFAPEFRHVIAISPSVQFVDLFEERKVTNVYRQKSRGLANIVADAFQGLADTTLKLVDSKSVGDELSQLITDTKCKDLQSILTNPVFTDYQKLLVVCASCKVFCSVTCPLPEDDFNVSSLNSTFTDELNLAYDFVPGNFYGLALNTKSPPSKGASNSSQV